MRKTFLFVVYSSMILLLNEGPLNAQSISGRVVNEDNTPLIGANIIVAGTSIGIATNADGIFSFQYIPVGKYTLIVSYIGYETLRVTYSPEDSHLDLIFMLKRENLFGKEITVVARKREESIKDVPVSMVSVREDMIENMGATSLEDLTTVVPNIFAYDEQTATEFTIRGIDGGARNPGMSTAEGVYLDGVIMGDPNFIVSDIVDMASVEFLRGPQGTLFGRNTVAGAINMITVKPTPLNTAFALMETGQWGYQKLKGSANIRLGEKVYTRFSGYSFDYDGYLKNAFDNKKEKFKNNKGGRLALRMLPTANWTIDFGLDYYDEDLVKVGEHISDYRISSSSALYNNMRLDSLYYAMESIDITDDGRYSYNHDTTSVSYRNLIGVTLNNNYRLTENLRLVSVFSYRKSTVNWFNDEDGTALDLLTGDWKNNGEQITSEFRLVSNYERRINWLAGVFYYNLYNFLSGPVFPKPLFFHYAAGIPMFIAKNYKNLKVHPEGRGRTSSLGAYGSMDVNLTEKLSFTIGVRYSADQLKFRYKQKGILTFGYINVPSELDEEGNPIGYFDSTKAWDALTPSLNIKYVLTSEVNIYGTLSKGYKSGGFNMDYVSTFESVSTPFKPEHITNYEIGFKASNRVNTLFINAALFRMKYKDMQVSQFQDLYEGYMISNAASSTITGLELDFSVRLLNNMLTLIGGYGRTEAVFNSFRDGYFNGYWDEGEEYTDSNENGRWDTGEPLDDMDNDYSGEHISLYPKQSWSLIANFQYPVNSKLMLVSQIRSDFLDEKLAQLTTDKDLNQLRDDARTLVNGQFGVQTQSWGAFVWGENLLNTEYIITQDVNTYMGFIEQVWGQPRLLGIRLTYNF